VVGHRWDPSTWEAEEGEEEGEFKASLDYLLRSCLN
jgi:hypothetical protein